jgi:2-keto-3-deoxy-L-rhamnonate aldolase RhmA
VHSPSLRGLLELRPLIGTFLKLAQPEVVEILAIAGSDFVICDTEHAQIDEAGVRTVVQAGRAAQIPVIVRVATLDAGQVNRYLEAGAAGIQPSGVTSARQVGELSAALRYPPLGRRGLSTAQPAAQFGQIPLGEYLEASNRELLGIGQLESADYADPLDDVMANLDLAFVGTMDLSVDLGCAGRFEAPEVQRVLREIEAAAQRTATPLGIFATTTDEAQHALTAGYRYIALSSDLALLAASARRQFAPFAQQKADARG